MISNDVKCKGDIKLIIEENDQTKIIEFNNAVLSVGTSALASSLANKFGGYYDYYINKIVVGDGGSVGGVPKVVTSERNGLFGVTRALKPVVATIDPKLSSRVIFTSVLGPEDANGYLLNEFGLQMNNGNIYSMATTSGFNKTSQMRVTIVWSLTFL